MHLIDTLDIVIICTCMSLPLTEHQQYSTLNAVKQRSILAWAGTAMKEIHTVQALF